MIMVGDLVTRKSYNNDIIFKVVDVRENIYYLCGVSVRLYADSYEDDLIVCKEEEEEFEVDFESYKTLDRNEYFYLPGKVLHIDGDKEFLDKCMKFYKKNKIKAYGIYSSELEVADNINDYLKKYNPDILVITGHDGMIKSGTRYNDIYNYRNSRYFIETVKEARRYDKENNRKLVIFAGACQSYFEAIISAGANFASSPARILIDFLDPLVVAEKVALTEKYRYITIDDIAYELRDGKDGVSGIGANGKMTKR